MGRIIAVILFVLSMGHEVSGASLWKPTVTAEQDTAEILVLAAATYAKAEQAATPSEAMQQFNRALELYQSLAVEHSSANLFFNVGNCFFHLGEYAWAVVYYERALALKPRSKRISRQLNTTLERLNLKATPRPQPVLSRYLGASHFAMRERVSFAIALAVMAGFVGSLAIWTGRRTLFQATVAISALALIVLTSALTLQFLCRPTAILTKGAVMRCDGGEHYAPIISEPLRAGSKVIVIGTTPDHQWIEVAAGNGLSGYVPAENVRSV